MKKNKLILFVIFVILIAIGGMSYYKNNSLRRAENNPKFFYGMTIETETEKTLFADKKVLVFVPHEDDDVNLMGGLLENYVKYGSAVYVVFASNGDYCNLAELRLQEAINVLEGHYGIPRKHIIFLGYGDEYKEGETHLYHAHPTEIVTSYNNKNHTYGTQDIRPYKEEYYTRENYKRDYYEIIQSIKPDTIFCVDMDMHSDHKLVSLIFEEVMGDILKEDQLYHPEVYKGFCYFGAWLGDYDFVDGENIKSIHYSGGENMEDNPVYRWADRVRMPVSFESVSLELKDSSTYEALSYYWTQDANSHAPAIVNGDKVFWKRRTDNLAMGASIVTSSGNVEALNDFKLVDTSQIRGGTWDSGIWIPDYSDDNPTITLSWEEEKTITSLKLYDNPSLNDNILGVAVKIGEKTIAEYGPLCVYGADTNICLDNVKTNQLTIELLEKEGENAGLLEIEAFGEEKDAKQRILKLMDENEDFAYNYQVDSNNCAILMVYEGGDKPTKGSLSDLSEFSVALCGTEDGQVKVEGNKIVVFCPDGEKGTLLLMDKDRKKIYDVTFIRGID